jgi:hypothetical protein
MWSDTEDEEEVSSEVWGKSLRVLRNEASKDGGAVFKVRFKTLELPNVKDGGC